VRAFVVTAPHHAGVQELSDPVAGPGEVVVEVERVGVCGTDVEFFTGEMAYLHEGHAEYPMRLGHEWCGIVAETGAGVDTAWVGQRVTADTMLGCGTCRLCLSARQHVCERRQEIGIRGGRPGALAERVPVPARALYPLPASVSVAAGALVEPGANALRAARAVLEGPEGSVLVCGPGTIGLLTALFLRSMGADVHVAGRSPGSVAFAHGLGLANAWSLDDLPDHPFDSVVDCSTADSVPRRAVEIVQPGGRVVFIGLSGGPSLVDTRSLVFKDVTGVGILSGSPGLAGTIEAYAHQDVVPEPLVAATVGLEGAIDALVGRRDDGGLRAPKMHIDPRR
jgi:threonine dehydrogenase-like Zn-dependent dehydrogenase